MSRLAKLFSVPELRNRVLAVLGLLVAYRALAAIPIPDVDTSRLADFFSSNSLLGFLNFFSGGGLSSMSLVMLGVQPYITSSIIMQLLTIIFPRLKELYYEDGERGRQKFNRITRYVSVPLSFISGYGFLSLLASQGIIPPMSAYGMLTSVLIITAGSMAALWIGELITEQKIGNGVSLIIFSGIVAGLPSQLGLAFQSLRPDVLIGYAIVALLIILGIVYVTEGERRIPVAYARQVRGNKLFGGAASYLPMKVNSAGMIPLIFAVAVLTFPQFVAQAIGLISPQWGTQLATWVNSFMSNTWAYSSFYFVLVFAFTYFYTSITFNPSEIAKNLQKNGGFIPGIRPGEQTESMLQRVTSRITFFGASALAIVAVIPTVIQGLIALASGTGMAASSSLALSGTAILIVVAVALESLRQIDSQLSLREYERN